MGNVQRSAADEDSGGALLFLLKVPLLHHWTECSIQTERGTGTSARAMWTKGNRGTVGSHDLHSTSSDVDQYSS